MLRNSGSGFWPFGLVLLWASVSQRLHLSPEIVSAITLLFGIFGLITGLYLFFRGFRLLQQKKWIEDTPTMKIAAAAVGQAKVFGKVTGPYTLLSPLAGADCYYYRAVAWGGGDSRDEGKPAGKASETLFAPFFVEDDTGRVMIDPRGAQIDLPAEYDEQISGDSMAEGSRRFLRRHGISIHGVTAVTEYCVKPGDSLFVLGTLDEDRGWGSMADEEPEQFAGAEERYLSPEAADLQRREQLEAMGMPESALPPANTKVPPGFELHARVVLRRGDDHQLLLLSRQSPQRVVDDLRRRSLVDIWGGAALALLSLGLVVQRFGWW